MISNLLFKVKLYFWVTILVIINAKYIASNKQCTLLTIDYTLKEINKCELGAGSSLHITYPNTQGNIVCNSTQLLSSVQTQPKVVFSNAQQGNTYTFAMVDPDAPSSRESYFLHWLLANITGNDIKKGNFNNSIVLDAAAAATAAHCCQVTALGTTLSSGLALSNPTNQHAEGQRLIMNEAYYPPSPPQGTGFHRYQFYVFNQPSWQINVTRIGTSRSKFDLADFASVNGLCEPIAGIQFLAEFGSVSSGGLVHEIEALYSSVSLPTNSAKIKINVCNKE